MQNIKFSNFKTAYKIFRNEWILLCRVGKKQKK